MSQPKWIKNIAKHVGKRPVLLVEGNTDVRILGYFLNQVSPNWDAQIVMRPANRKSQVIEAIKYRPEWVGIVDKDEWAPTDTEHTFWPSKNECLVGALYRRPL